MFAEFQQPFGFDWTDWRVLAVVAFLFVIAGATFLIVRAGARHKIRATALFFMKWYLDGDRQGRSWEKDVAETFGKSGHDLDTALALARRWWHEVADEDLEPHWEGARHISD